MSFRNKIGKLYKDYCSKRHFFGILNSFLFSLSPYIQLGNEKKHKSIESYLTSHYSDVIEKYSNSHFEEYSISADSYIWVLWMQGVQQMPPLVKQCYNSLLKNKGQHKVVLLDSTNLYQYVEFPVYIKEKLEKGTISFTHFSDIVRANLLAKYGGLWIDSTIFVTSPIGKIETPYFSIKQHSVYKRYVEGGNKWTAFMIGCPPKNPILSFMSDFFNEYWKKEDGMIDYYLIDYVTTIAYHKFEYFKKTVDENPFYEDDIYYMQGVLTETYNETIDEKIKGIKYNKLNWRTVVDSESSVFNHFFNGKAIS